MTCEDFEQLIALEVAGDLPTNEASRAQAHLKDCAACRNLAEELGADREWLQAVHRQPADRAALHQVRVGVMRQLEAEQSRWNRPFGGLAVLGWRWVIVTAAVAIVLGAAAWWISSLKQRPAIVALDSMGRNDLPGIKDPQPDRKPQPGIAQSQAASEANESAAPTPRTLIPRASHETKSPPSHSESASAPERPPTSRQEKASNPQLAQIAPPAGETAAAQPRGNRLESGAQMKIVTTVLNEPEEPPSETVMLKVPTSNPNIVVYWLMDEEKQPQADELNQGD